jgi:hypothetical protein
MAYASRQHSLSRPEIGTGHRRRSGPRTVARSAPFELLVRRGLNVRSRARSTARGDGGGGELRFATLAVLVVALASLILAGLPGSGQGSVQGGERAAAAHTSLGSVRLASYESNDWLDVPLPSGIEGLEGISCPSAQVCVAVGYGQNGGIIVDTTNGGASWTEPYSIAGAGEFRAVSCASASLCAVSGESAYYFDPLVPDSLESASGGGDAESMSCAPDGDEAVCGEIQAPFGTGQYVAISTDGGETWSSAPSAPGFQSGSGGTTFGGIYCEQNDDCVASALIAFTFGAPDTDIGFTSDLFGSNADWTNDFPWGDGVGYVSQIACASASDCLGVGYQGWGQQTYVETSTYCGEDPNDEGYCDPNASEHWSYLGQSPVDPTDDGQVAFVADECTSDDNCIAVGSNTDSGLAEIWSANISDAFTPGEGGTALNWTQNTVPLSDASASLQGVACLTDDSACFAVGDIQSTGAAVLLSDVPQSVFPQGNALGPDQYGGGGGPQPVCACATREPVNLATGTTTTPPQT